MILNGGVATQPSSRHAYLEAALAARRAEASAQPHMARLNAYRAALAACFGEVPQFDPLDAGDQAAVLLLLETPGPRAGSMRTVSRDNPTGTARNITRFCERAVLERRHMVIWNAVPWIIHAPGARNRAPRRSEVAAGLALLPDLLRILPDLRVAILAGCAARQAAPLVRDCRPDLLVLEMAHPSPVYVNTAPHIAPALVATLEHAARHIR